MKLLTNYAASNVLFWAPIVAALYGAVFHVIPVFFVGSTWLLSGAVLQVLRSNTILAHVASGFTLATVICILYTAFFEVDAVT